MRITRFACCLLGLALAPLSFGQSAASAPSANPVSDALRQGLARSSKNMIAAAEAMPAEKYSYKPTDPEMTYAHLLLHIADTNFRFCGAVSGTTAPEQPKLTETDSKDKLVGAVKASFDFCSTALAKLDDSHLADSIELFGGHKFSRAASILILSGSWADHYSSQAIYLRLNNLLPPTAQPQK
jgi:hypothetical protein